ncbi:Dolichyl-phosphate-mannose-protein mannosyltransferase [Micromonospora purpureochromogenes]|uniref:Dolichyl-phosphate-mannose-protein mannosyltransferase n=1 Tax=Micromonospora purpureochromogenes TaxID=47872 RepID=A0A1C4W3M2_9ACTN|nr:glycosyltransferase family 39 protein [Micromonospora purpureochromogenes]SCE90621.1 Dolichyl-phosphate-mannose-protein mannosyltransferase [Micromonospora purpureochromogenes]
MSGKRHAVEGWARLVWVPPLLATLIAGLYRIGHAQPWRDELATWSAATRPLGDLLRLTDTVDAATGPYYLLMHGWVRLFGDSATALRLPSALAMAGAAGLTAVLGRWLLGTRAGLLAGLLFAVLPGTSRYAQEARPYALASLFAVLATLLLVAALRRPTWTRWAGYAAAVAALGLTHLLALTLLAAHAAVVLNGAVHDRDGRLPVRWVLAVLPALALLTPLLLTARGQRSRQLDWVEPARLADLAALPGGVAQSSVVGGLLVGLAALGAVRAGRRALLPGLCLLLPVLLVFVGALVVALWVPRYLVFTVPFASVLAGAALAGAPTADPTAAEQRRPGASARAAAAGSAASASAAGASVPAAWASVSGALAVVVLAGLLGLPDQAALRQTHGWPRSATVDYRGAARIIAAGQQPGDAVVVHPRDGWLFLDLGLAYHLDARPRDVLVVRDQRQRADLWATECARPAECLAGVRRVWLVVAGRGPDPVAAVPGAKGDALRAGFTVGQVWQRPGVTVALLTARG